ncbi:MarR family transcriptional regulator [Streptomyces monashensis]|uniref:MarR family transcriptional regulator n=1 Tax=Streptomyces monashensis TaxID=1678012 RepID=UPI0033FBEA34
MADLAAEFAIGIGAMSKGIDRLEGHGRVARQPNPADRRSAFEREGVGIPTGSHGAGTVCLNDSSRWPC